MIFIHELGHFAVARSFKVKINEFAIGMGPKILTKVSSKSNIRYSLRAFPIGGYVSMDGEGNESTDPNAFCNKPIWQRMLVIAAGPAMNILLGIICMTILVTWSGLSAGCFSSNTVAKFAYSESGELQSISCNYGLEVGDKIVKVGNTPTHTGSEVAYEIMNNGYQAIDLTVIRGDKTVVLEDVVFPTFEDEQTGILFGDMDFIVYGQKVTFLSVIEQSFYRSCSTVKMIWDSFFGLITGRFGFNAMSGPVGITKEIGTAASAGDGGMTLLYFITVITINLGVFNFFPFPALDGGQFLLLLIQLVTRKKISQKVVGAINFMGLVILLGLMVAVTFKDIIGLF